VDGSRICVRGVGRRSRSERSRCDVGDGGQDDYSDRLRAEHQLVGPERLDPEGFPARECHDRQRVDVERSGHAGLDAGAVADPERDRSRNADRHKRLGDSLITVDGNVVRAERQRQRTEGSRRPQSGSDGDRGSQDVDDLDFDQHADLDRDKLDLDDDDQSEADGDVGQDDCVGLFDEVSSSDQVAGLSVRVRSR